MGRGGDGNLEKHHTRQWRYGSVVSRYPMFRDWMGRWLIREPQTPAHSSVHHMWAWVLRLKAGLTYTRDSQLRCFNIVQGAMIRSCTFSHIPSHCTHSWVNAHVHCARKKKKSGIEFSTLNISLKTSTDLGWGPTVSTPTLLTHHIHQPNQSVCVKDMSPPPSDDE